MGTEDPTQDGVIANDAFKQGYCKAELVEEWPAVNRGALMDEKDREITQGLLGERVRVIPGGDGAAAEKDIKKVRQPGGRGEHY